MYDAPEGFVPLSAAAAEAGVIGDQMRRWWQKGMIRGLVMPNGRLYIERVSLEYCKAAIRQEKDEQLRTLGLAHGQHVKQYGPGEDS